MLAYRILAALVVFVGATLKIGFVWGLADLFMAIMTLINIPVIIILGRQVLDALADYQRQSKDGKNPVFKAQDIGLNTSELDNWK